MTIRMNLETKVGIQRAYDIRSHQSKTRTRPEMDSELNQTINILLDVLYSILEIKPAAASKSAAKAVGGTSRVQQKMQGGASWVDTACMRPSQELLSIDNLNSKVIEPHRQELISGIEKEERAIKSFLRNDPDTSPDDETYLEIRTRMAEFNLKLSEIKNKLRRRSGGRRGKRPYSIGLKRKRRRALAKEAINKYIIYPTVPIY